MNITKAAAKMLVFVRQRRAARTRRSLQHWIALTIARLMTFAVVGGLVYITYIVEMAGYDHFRKCNKNSTLTRVKWVLGFRPAEDCRSL
jgi:hypothetical protein